MFTGLSVGKTKIRIKSGGESRSFETKVVNVHGMWMGGFPAGSHSIIEIGDAKPVREVRTKRERRS